MASDTEIVNKLKRSGVAYSVRYPLEPRSEIIDEEVGTYEEDESGEIRLTLTKMPWGGDVLMRPQPK
jgi:hypothetical protein